MEVLQIHIIDVTGVKIREHKISNRYYLIRTCSLKPTEPRLLVPPPSLVIQIERKAPLPAEPEPGPAVAVGAAAGTLRSSSSPMWKRPLPAPASEVRAILSRA